MNLYLISQESNTGYDTYDSAVVAAELEEEARLIHPDGHRTWDSEKEDWFMTCNDGSRSYDGRYGTWASAEQVKCELLGEALMLNKGVVLASFNAG